ncbi:MAG: LysM peptidoglycan-binding domain-containing protein [Eubacteriales bacterium]|jgi:nucleoid-associated protein YgaU|nr:LysM peptidoglycan-binding domain-containing protein [Eubacteriales bacterium]
MRKKVMIVAGLICATLVIITILSSVQAQNISVAKEWTVRRGDTLWNIAAENRGNTEIRKYIYQIQKLNDIGSTIYPGQTLLLPPGK